MKFTTIAAVLASAFMVSAAAVPIDLKNTVAIAEAVTSNDVKPSVQPVETSVKSYIIVLKNTVAAQDFEIAERAIIKVGGTVEHRYTAALKGFSVWLSTRGYKTLLANPLVAYIEEDSQVKVLTI